LQESKGLACMVNIEEIKKAFPEDNLLCELIETDMTGVIVDEQCSEDMLGYIINAVYLYKMAGGGSIRVFLIGDVNNTPYIKKLMKGYGVTDNFEFVGENDYDKLLTRFLGSEAIITSNSESECAKLAKEFYIPRLCLSDRNDCVFSNGVFHIGSEPSVISAGLMIIKERKYTDELSGHKRLV